ncbi:MAG TPA: Omp28-related outer membrane protein, partial [Bacteroidia bacterium]|nr:Omp28-related outer membrane protein [Bacteroidia bacterium]
ADYAVEHPDGADGPPVGMVNRLGMPSQTELNQRTEWANMVDSLVQEDACTSIHIDHTYNTATRQLGVTVWGTWLQAHTGDVRVAIMLTESGMVGWQTDDQVCDEAYVFHDVLRECINTPGSITGITVGTGTSVIGATWSYLLPTAYTLPATYDANNCQLVAIFYDATTGEVLQAWEEEL